MILFLDFDGVLHPDPCRERQLFCRIRLFEDVMLEFPAVEIVISSSWRFDYKHEHEHECVVQLRKHFSFEIAARIVGVTPDQRSGDQDSAPVGLRDYLRHWECVSWLSRNRPPGTPWLALDDRPALFRPDCENLMIIEDGRVGFTEDHQDILRKRLVGMSMAG